MSPLLGDAVWHASSVSGDVSCKLLYSVYLPFFALLAVLIVVEWLKDSLLYYMLPAAIVMIVCSVWNVQQSLLCCSPHADVYWCGTWLMLCVLVESQSMDDVPASAVADAWAWCLWLCVSVCVCVSCLCVCESKLWKENCLSYQHKIW